MYAHIKSDKPMALYQFSLTQVHGHNHQASGDEADPSMIMIPPIEQYATTYTFTTPRYSLGTYTNYFMFIVDAQQKDGLRLDHHHLPTITQYHHIPGTHLAAGYVPISVGTHTVRHTNSSVVIGGMLFGRANHESYGFPVGLLMKVINPGTINQPQGGCTPIPMKYGDETDNDCDGKTDEETCDGIDDDEDGRIDEDCRCCDPSVIVGK